MEARIQKLLASAGIASRRSCEALIAAGKVRVNGKVVTEAGVKANPETDVIELDGKRVSFEVEKIYIVLNKPTGYVSTVQDRHAKHKVVDLVQGVSKRIYPVGRLDADSAGLLLLTNDGDFTERLTHPKHQVPKTYRVIVRGEVPSWAAADLRQGILLDDGMTAPAEVEWVDYDAQNNATIIDITIHEGRNRQVRRMFDAVGFPVLALTRMRIGPIQLKGLAPGTWRKLHPSEIKALLEAADSTEPSLPRVMEEEPVEPPPTPRPPRKPAPVSASVKPAAAKKPAAANADPLRDEAKELASKLRAADRAGDGDDNGPRRNSVPRRPKK